MIGYDIYILEKLSSRKPYGKHCVGPKFLFVKEMCRRNLFLSDKIIESHFYDCKEECLRD